VIDRSVMPPACVRVNWGIFARNEPEASFYGRKPEALRYGCQFQFIYDNLQFI